MMQNKKLDEREQEEEIFKQYQTKLTREEIYALLKQGEVVD